MKKNYEEIFTSEKITVLSNKKNDSRIMNLTCPIYQTNFLTDAKQILNKGTYRAIKFIVKQIQDERIMLESYIKNNETLKINISREDILRWYPDEHAHRELKAAAEKAAEIADAILQVCKGRCVSGKGFWMKRRG